MPFISVHTSKELNNEIKEQIKSDIGQIIEFIPGKTEAALMVEIIDNLYLAFKGEYLSDLCYVDIRCFGQAKFDDNKIFGEALCQKIHENLDIPIQNIYYTITEYDTWGSKGTFKQK